MDDLRRVFRDRGFNDVRTYIQSGNVLFESSEPRSTLEHRIEELMALDLRTPVVVVVRSLTQLRNVVQRAPDGFGGQPDRFHYDVVYLKAPVTAQSVLNALTPREGVDRAWAGTGVVYFERLSARRSQSRMTRITAIPQYASMSIRNWNTTTKLLSLLDTRRD